MSPKRVPAKVTNLIFLLCWGVPNDLYWGLGGLVSSKGQIWSKIIIKYALTSTKICYLVNTSATFTCKIKAASTPNMERQHLKFHALASVFTRLQTSTHALLGQPSPNTNNYKQLSFLDPLLFRFQISKALSELATTRHTHTHIHIHKHTNTRTHTPIYSLDRNV